MAWWLTGMDHTYRPSSYAALWWEHALRWAAAGSGCAADTAHMHPVRAGDKGTHMGLLLDALSCCLAGKCQQAAHLVCCLASPCWSA
jgi:hypothetical protein